MYSKSSSFLVYAFPGGTKPESILRASGVCSGAFFFLGPPRALGFGAAVSADEEEGAVGADDGAVDASSCRRELNDEMNSMAIIAGRLTTSE